MNDVPCKDCITLVICKCKIQGVSLYAENHLSARPLTLPQVNSIGPESRRDLLLMTICNCSLLDEYLSEVELYSNINFRLTQVLETLLGYK